MKKLFLIRHGTTHFNDGVKIINGRESYQGKTISQDYNPDLYPQWVDLNEKGHRQAAQAAETLSGLVDSLSKLLIFSSELKRAKDTANYTAKKFNQEFFIDGRLNEYVWQRRTEKEEEAFNRINDFLHKKIEENSPNVLLVFSHENLLKLYLSRVSGQPIERIGNCEIIETMADQHGCSIKGRYF